MQKKICFLDQSKALDQMTANFFKLLFETVDATRFVEVPLEEAEYVLFSPFSPDHHAANPETIKILISGENMCPDFNACDYAISSEFLELGDRHLRMPVYSMFEAAKGLISRAPLSQIGLENKTNFCNFIYSNARWADPFREKFFHTLDNVSPVVSAGRFLQNDTRLSGNEHGTDWGVTKRKMVESFRFTIAIENSEHPGYVTEKITDALLCNTIPIYWGDPRVLEEFDTEAFIHLRDFTTLEDAVAEIQRIDADPSRMLNMMNAPVFSGGIDRTALHLNAAREFFEAIFDQPLANARRRPRHGWVQSMESKRRSDQTGFKRRLKRNRF